MSKASGLGRFDGLRWRDGFLTAAHWFAILTPVALVIGFISKALSDAIDRPAFDAIDRAGTNGWTDVVSTLTKMGNVPQTQLLVAVLAIVLAVWFWRRGERWWMPIFVLPTAWVVARIFQFGIAKIVDRDRDAISLLGTNIGAFPSGGVMRFLIVTGTAVFLAAHYGGTSTRTQKLSYAVVAVLGLAEAYFRTRLNQHWLTDVISGVIIGWLFVGVVIATVRAFDPRPLKVAGLPCDSGAAEVGTPAVVDPSDEVGTPAVKDPPGPLSQRPPAGNRPHPPEG